MPARSPLLHAPSLAQHRIVALMALWFSGAMGWGGIRWWQGSARAFFPFAAGVGVFVAVQLLAQGWVLAALKKWRAPGWVKFSAAALPISWIFLRLQLRVLALTDPFALVLGSWLTLLPMGAWYMAWYGSW